MHIEYLNYLTAIQKERSISAAARQLYMRQSSLSSILNSIENELGFTLFERAPWGVTVTPSGQQFLEAAKNILPLYEQLLSVKNDGYPSEIESQVKILVSSSTASCFALPLNKQLAGLSPRTTLFFLEAPQGNVIQRMEQKGINIGIAHFSNANYAHSASAAKSYGITIESLFTDHFFLLIGKKHRLTGKKRINIKELGQDRLAMGTYFNASPSGTELSPLYQSGSHFTAFPNIELIKEAVKEQNMISILTGCTIWSDGGFDADEYEVLQLDGLDGENKIDVCLFIKGSDTLLHTEKLLISCIRNIAEEISQHIRKKNPDHIFAPAHHHI